VRAIIESVAACMLVTGSAVCMSHKPDSSELRNAATNLGSSDFLAATDATRTLFAVRRGALPLLIGQFKNRARFRGLCGSAILESTAVTKTPNDDSPPAEQPRDIAVREAALYLVVAVLHNELYHGKSCELQTSNQSGIEGPLTAALEEIAALYAVQSSDLKAADVDAILRRADLRFGTPN